MEVRRRDEPWTTKARIKHRLGRRILAARRTSEPSLVLPERYHEFAVRSARRIVDETAQLGPAVIGDLDDLLVTTEMLQLASSSSRRTMSRPEDVTTDDLLEAAIDGLVGLARKPNVPEG